MGLPKPPEPHAERVNSLDGLAPRFRDAVSRVLDQMRKAGFDPLVYETTRTDARQRYLYGFGRSYDDGRGIVTRSIGIDHTWHGFGLAVDIISASRQWAAPKAFWDALRAAAEEEGLAWGGDWPTMRDLPHVQWGKPMRRSPTWRAMQLKKQGGNEAVWQEVGAA